MKPHDRLQEEPVGDITDGRPQASDLRHLLEGRSDSVSPASSTNGSTISTFFGVESFHGDGGLDDRSVHRVAVSGPSIASPCGGIFISSFAKRG